MVGKITKWNIQDYLKTEEDRQAYLDAAIEEGDPRMIMTAMHDVAKARGITKTARKMNVSREGLSKALNGKTMPKIDMFFGMLQAMDLKVQLVPAE
jgi:probable addiction module antidote protein